MKCLIISEWERLWKRKISLLIILVIPVMILAAVKYCLQTNKSISNNEAQYVVVGNFPVFSISEMIPTAFNMIALMLLAFVVTEEYRTGQIRMILFRAYSFKKIILAKLLVVLSAILLYFIIYFVASVAIGFLCFDNPESYPLFFHDSKVGIVEGMFYNLRFYGMSFLTIVATAMVFFFIAITCKTVTGTLGCGIGFIVFSMVYPYLLGFVRVLFSAEVYMKLFFTSIPMIQWQGLTLTLASTPQYAVWIFTMLFAYIFLFGLGTYLIIRKKDNFI